MRNGDGFACGNASIEGHKITGSDQNVYPPMSTQLEELGIEILNGYKAENADIGADCVIVGNAISRGNAELEEVLNRKLLYRSQAEIVKEEFIRGRRSLGCCRNARQDDDDEYCGLGCGSRRA